MESVGAKWRAVRDYAELLRRPCRFLIPRANEADVGIARARHNDENARGNVEHVRVEYVGPDPNALDKDLFTDGCEDYEKFLQQLSTEGRDDFDTYTRKDVEGLEETANTLIADSAGPADEPLRAGYVLPFENDPLPAAKHVLKWLLDKRPPGEDGLPFRALPLPVAPPDVSESEAPRPADRVLRRIKRGLGELCDKEVTISDTALYNLIVSFADRLLLVIYDSKSSKVEYDKSASGKDEQGRLGRVWTDCNVLPLKPRVLLLASDYYHHKDLSEATGCTIWKMSADREAWY